ncbi:APO protein 4, mitochondrial isoform X2 [Manihot esculenta]|nr:APO protein 4, mitochondrial isoform X2 [Manihot esculenta]KAG8642798.1 hypothetical protein MANES_12G122900v8 [Manihot esculenta]KAG8642802.1 hypothetical protein MANES_12G122900v8 [Manihot esculenta]
MMLKRIEERPKDYPIRDMVPVARDVLKARMLLIQGVSTLIQAIPVVACKFCPEVYIGEKGHLIQTCWGYNRRGAKNRVHEWITGGLNDILIPVETFRLSNMSQKVIKHNQRFNFDRIPAVVELCRQAGVDLTTENLYPSTSTSQSGLGGIDGAVSLSSGELNFVANRTLRAWETLRSGVQKLLVYPAKVCKYCSEIHVGPSGHKDRFCGIFRHENLHPSHLWRKARVDDLVPPKIVWRQRPQDPPVLLNKGREFYGHAPAVVDLCTKAGVITPPKYSCMMKVQGLSAPV